MTFSFLSFNHSPIWYSSVKHLTDHLSKHASDQHDQLDGSSSSPSLWLAENSEPQVFGHAVSMFSWFPLREGVWVVVKLWVPHLQPTDVLTGFGLRFCGAGLIPWKLLLMAEPEIEPNLWAFVPHYPLSVSQQVPASGLTIVPLMGCSLCVAKLMMFSELAAHLWIWFLKLQCFKQPGTLHFISLNTTTCQQVTLNIKGWDGSFYLCPCWWLEWTWDASVRIQCHESLMLQTVSDIYK